MNDCEPPMQLAKRHAGRPASPLTSKARTRYPGCGCSPRNGSLGPAKSKGPRCHEKQTMQRETQRQIRYQITFLFVSGRESRPPVFSRRIVHLTGETKPCPLQFSNPFFLVWPRIRTEHWIKRVYIVVASSLLYRLAVDCP